MNFVPQTSFSIPLMVAAIVVFVIVGVLVVVLNVAAEKRRSRSLFPPILNAVSSVILAFSAVLAINMGIHSPTTQRPIFEEQVQDRYGVKLTPEQLSALSYPSSRPGDELQTYGATVLEEKVEGDLYRKQKVQLISENGKLKLSHYENGKGFKELPRKDVDR